MFLPYKEDMGGTAPDGSVPTSCNIIDLKHAKSNTPIDIAMQKSKYNELRDKYKKSKLVTHLDI